MIKGDYKKVLWQIFDVLGFTEEEKQYAAEKFKKRFAADLLRPLQERLSSDHQAWIRDNMDNQFIDRGRAMEIQVAIRNAYKEDEIDRYSYNVFKAILVRYATFMVQKLNDKEKSSKISRIVDGF